MDTQQIRRAWFDILIGGAALDRICSIKGEEILEAKVGEDGWVRFFSDGIMVKLLLPYSDIPELLPDRKFKMTNLGGGKYEFHYKSGQGYFSLTQECEIIPGYSAKAGVVVFRLGRIRE